MQQITEADWSCIAESTRTFREAWGPARLAFYAAVNRMLTAPRHALSLIAGPERARNPSLQAPWLPKWRGLTAQPFHDAQSFEWNARLEAAHPMIKAELEKVLAENVTFERAHYTCEGSPWKAFYFFLHGKRIEENCARCPRTAAFLDSLPINHAHICFSAMPPGGQLKPHVGPTNASLVCHFGVLNCEGATIYAGDQERQFHEGKAVILDDSFVHSVVHRGERTRYSLMITLWHYDLTPIERGALKLILRRMLS
jgi:aspartyl/asparaginyl beta-hydroxylase (cupin superfamily)